MSSMYHRSTGIAVGLVGLTCVIVAFSGCKQYSKAPIDFSPLTTESPLITESPLSEPTDSTPTVDYEGKGNELLQARRYEQALHAYDDAIAAGEDLAGAYAGRGRAYAALRRFREAVEDYDASLKYDRTADVLASRCNALRLLARPAEAMEDCEEAISLDSDNVDAHLASALLWLEQNDLNKARAEVGAAEEINPKSAEAQYALAQIEVAAGEYEAAATALSECIELDPSQPRYYWDRGFIHYSLGRFEEAKADMRAVLEYGDPETDGELMFNAGKLLRSLGEEP